MALIELERPVIATVYRPMMWRWQSTNYMQPLRFYGGTIVSIRRPTTAEIAAYPGLTTGDVVVEHGSISPVYAGELWQISNTASGLYVSEYKVLRSVSTSLTVIGAEYEGDESGGDVQVVLGNFVAFVDVTVATLQGQVKISHALKPIYSTTYNGYVFELDVSDAIARTFGDLTDRIAVTDTLILNADGYIATAYTVSAYEGYDVVSGDNKIEFVQSTGERLTSAPARAYNVAHPYHQVERDGSVTLDWQSLEGSSGFNSYLLHSGTVTGRFLTFQSRTTQKVSSGESHFLAWLWDGAASKFQMRCRFYSQDGTLIMTQFRGNLGPVTLKGMSFIVNVGPRAVSPPAGTAYYLVDILPFGESVTCSEVMRLNIVECKGVARQWFFQNKMCGIDQFTFDGEETRSIGVKRSMLSKSRMSTYTSQQLSTDPTVAAWRGGWNRKVWKVDSSRKYTITSGYMLPLAIRAIMEALYESVNVFTCYREPWWTGIIITSSEVPVDGSTAKAERIAINYELGTDVNVQRL